MIVFLIAISIECLSNIFRLCTITFISFVKFYSLLLNLTFKGFVLLRNRSSRYKIFIFYFTF